MSEVVQFQEPKTPDKPDSRPTLPRSLERLIFDRGPLDWEGDWYQRRDGSWAFQSRWRGEDQKPFNPDDVPEPVREQARVSLQEFEASMRPATADEIQAGLSEIAIVTGSKASDGEEVWGARYAIYAKHLSDIPRDILRRAMDAHIRESVFFPKIAELRERSEGELKVRKFEISRLRRLLGKPPQEPSMTERAGEKLRVK